MPETVTGDLLDQDVEVIVNAWNRNIIPRWLLLPQGVSRAIKRRAGPAPFRELDRMGAIEEGGARLTSAGDLPHRAIIHVAGINLLWVATRASITRSVHNAMALVDQNDFRSVAFPLIGSGSGNRGRAFSRSTMLEAFAALDSDARVLLVEYPT